MFTFAAELSASAAPACGRPLHTGLFRSMSSASVSASMSIRQGIELSRVNVLLDLVIPCRPIELKEPGAKLRKLLGGERLNPSLDLLDLAHDHRPVRIL